MPPVEFSRSAFAAALAFEAGLGLLALAAGALLGHSPLVGTPGGAAGALVTGALAALPLAGVLALTDRLPFEWLRELRRLAEDLLPLLFPRATRLQLALVSLAAGCGEELLFRGLIQAGVARWVGGDAGVWLGLAVGSALFGLAHPLTRAYAAVAAAIGLYLGALMLITGSILAPIAAHAVYDYLALEMLFHRDGPPATAPAASPVQEPGED